MSTKTPNVKADTAKVAQLHRDFDEALETGHPEKAVAFIKEASAILKRDPAALTGAL